MILDLVDLERVTKCSTIRGRDVVNKYKSILI